MVVKIKQWMLLAGLLSLMRKEMRCVPSPMSQDLEGIGTPQQRMDAIPSGHPFQRVKDAHRRHFLRTNLLPFLTCGLLLVGMLAGMIIVRTSAVHAVSSDIAPGDPNIHYFGRWDASSRKTFVSYWGGAYLKTAFTGSTVQLKLGGSVSIYTSIDSGPDSFFSINAGGSVNLTPMPLASGTHTLRVASKAESYSIQFRGLVLDAGAITVAPAISSQLIEFVGDSITAGYHNSHAALSDYAWLTGEQLQVEHTQIAYSGICLVDKIACYSPNSIGISRQFFKLQTPEYPDSSNWDFSRYQASAVVINIGTNDNSCRISNDVFQSAYIRFLQGVRVAYPRAPIFVLRTFGGYKASVTQAVVALVKAAGDKNVYYIDTTGWLSASDFVDGLHPSDAGQRKVANKLARILALFQARAD